MIVIIIISGIITCGAIISTKYYYEDDISGIFYLVVRFTRWKLRKRHIAHYLGKIDAQKETTTTFDIYVFLIRSIFVFLI
jgi:hypothetical protein